jgi:hypothetical protein
MPKRYPHLWPVPPARHIPELPRRFLALMTLESFPFIPICVECDEDNFDLERAAGLYLRDFETEDLVCADCAGPITPQLTALIRLACEAEYYGAAVARHPHLRRRQTHALQRAAVAYETQCEHDAPAQTGSE